MKDVNCPFPGRNKEKTSLGVIDVRVHAETNRELLPDLPLLTSMIASTLFRPLMNNRPCFWSIAMAVAMAAGAIGHLVFTTSARESSTATSFLSRMLI